MTKFSTRTQRHHESYLAYLAVIFCTHHRLRCLGITAMNVIITTHHHLKDPRVSRLCSARSFLLNSLQERRVQAMYSSLERVLLYTCEEIAWSTQYHILLYIYVLERNASHRFRRIYVPEKSGSKSLEPNRCMLELSRQILRLQPMAIGLGFCHNLCICWGPTTHGGIHSSVAIF